MFSYKLSDISKITKSEYAGKSDIYINHIQIDSRTYFDVSQSIFLAIPGKQHNGHSYIKDLYDKGCRNFWVQNNQTYPQFSDANYIISKNVIDAFQCLISNFRSKFTFPIIGITGSNGKTIVKEWLYHICKQEYSVVRSPRSFNSQIGVPLSLMLLDSTNNFGIIEAGISELNEMVLLEKMIHPTIGIFTNIGDAHQENFKSLQEKVQEKMKLFTHTKKLIYCSDYEIIHAEALQLQNTKLYSWGFAENSMIQASVSSKGSISYITLHWEHKTHSFTIPFTDKASVENAIHCFVTLIAIGISDETTEYFIDLPQIAMRLELKSGKNNCTLINDSYNSDFQSVKIALEFLSQQKQNNNKTLLLSDVKQTGIPLDELYKNIADLINQYSISRVIGVGTDISKYLKTYIPQGSYYESTQAFLTHFQTHVFRDETILLKAAREFQFELIAKQIENQTHQTVLDINLNAIVTNLHYFKSYLQPKTKIMVMVKAFSYGSGSFEIANILQHHRVDYLAVAFVDEGVELRNAGITLPIVVMNPEYGMMNQLFEYNLEPNIHNFSVLQEYVQICEQYPEKTFPIHIKIDTGMARYGFSPEEIPLLSKELPLISNCKIASVFSHLVGSDEARFDDFTETQIQLFKTLSKEITKQFSYPIMLHILNSAGIERFSQHQFDMVRLGIGLYGISSLNDENCMNISTLKTFVSGIREMQTGTTVGYSRNGKILKPSIIGVLPIGYADGLSRKLSNGVGSVIVNKVEVPIIGNICMDATMIDITNVDVSLGDEVIVFGKELPISVMAKKIGTIPYEIITSVSRRVKRIYYFE